MFDSRNLERRLVKLKENPEIRENKSYGQFRNALDVCWSYLRNDSTLEDWLMTLSERERDNLYGHPFVMREDLLP